MPSLVVFLLLLITMAAWLLLALVPAILELRLPRDADPLAGVGRDAGGEGIVRVARPLGRSERVD